MLNRDQRLQRMQEMMRGAKAEIVLASEMIDPVTSEDLFDMLDDPESAVGIFKKATKKFVQSENLKVGAVTKSSKLPQLDPASRFKYSPHGGGSYAGYRQRLKDNEDVTVFVVQEKQIVIGYALIDLSYSNIGHEIRVLDVELLSRRQMGFGVPIKVEGQQFVIGAGHVLVASIVDYFSERLRADANIDSSRYVFKSLGFSRYGGGNPCLLETRPV